MSYGMKHSKNIGAVFSRINAILGVENSVCGIVSDGYWVFSKGVCILRHLKEIQEPPIGVLFIVPIDTPSVPISSSH